MEKKIKIGIFTTSTLIGGNKYKRYLFLKQNSFEKYEYPLY